MRHKKPSHTADQTSEDEGIRNNNITRLSTQSLQNNKPKNSGEHWVLSNQIIALNITKLDEDIFPNN